MKYASNHWWKFQNPRLAWMSGFLQVTAMILVAGINYIVITVSDNVLDVAKDFTALLIIADFDDLLSTITETYAGSDEPALDALSSADYENLLMIDVTTSANAASNSNMKLPRDEILDRINRRRALARKGYYDPDDDEDMKTYEDGGRDLDKVKVAGGAWFEIRDEAMKRYPPYSQQDWFVSTNLFTNLNYSTLARP